MTVDHEHPYLSQLRQQLRDNRIDRREFLRTATLLGMAAGAAYAVAGLPAPARAQEEMPKGGKIEWACTSRRSGSANAVLGRADQRAGGACST